MKDLKIYKKKKKKKSLTKFPLFYSPCCPHRPPRPPFKLTHKGFWGKNLGEGKKTILTSVNLRPPKKIAL